MSHTVILSLAFRELIQANGGLVQAAERCGRKKSILACYGDPNSCAMAPLDVVADLELASGCTAVSDALRGLHAVQGDNPPPECPHAIGNRLGAAAGAVNEEIMIAMEDETVTPREARRIYQRIQVLRTWARASAYRVAGWIKVRRAA